MSLQTIHYKPLYGATNDKYYHLRDIEHQENHSVYTYPYEKSIDATYIIHLIGNGREESIQKQLSLCKPTRNTYILYNEGFRKSDKQLPVNDSIHDLIDAYLYIMRDSKKRGYSAILILEDDFIFDEKIGDKEVVHDIRSFIDEKKDSSFIYSFGVIPYLMIPDTHKSCRVFAKTGTHAAVYSSSCCTTLLDTPQEYISDWDVFTNMHISNYCYSRPLCYQLFPETENYNNWGNDHPIKIFISKGIKCYMKYYQLDTSIEGYEQTYTNALYFVYGMELFVFIIVLLCIGYVIRHSMSKIKSKVPHKSLSLR